MRFDLHCDTLTKLYENQNHDLASADFLHVNLEKMRLGGIGLECFAVFDNAELTGHEYDAYVKMIDWIEALLEKHASELCRVVSFSDIQKGIAKGVPMAMLTAEDLSSLQGDMDRFMALYQRGVRIVGLCWNYDTFAGCGNFVGNLQYKDADGTLYAQKGLKPFGFEVVEFLNGNPGAVDVSHLSDQGFWDVASVAKKPFLATHSNARALCGVTRNLTDEMIHKMADGGGIAGVNFCADFLFPHAGMSRLSDIVCHMVYMLNKGGEDFVALGSDFDGIASALEIKDAGGMDLLFDEMARAGISARVAEKIAWGNAYRFLGDVL